MRTPILCTFEKLYFFIGNMLEKRQYFIVKFNIESFIFADDIDETIKTRYKSNRKCLQVRFTIHELKCFKQNIPRQN